MAARTEAQKLQFRYFSMLGSAISATQQLHSIGSKLGIPVGTGGEFFWPINPVYLRKELRKWYEREKEKLRAKEKVPRDLGAHQE